MERSIMKIVESIHVAEFIDIKGRKINIHCKIHNVAFYVSSQFEEDKKKKKKSIKSWPP